MAVDLSRFHHGVAWLTVACCAAACVPAGLRWLRVAQREHYLAGSVLRFAGRWWWATPANIALAAAALVAAIVSIGWPVAGVVVAGVAALGPLGLSLRGRTSPLAWTRRLRRLAVAWALLEIVIVVIGVASGVASLLAVVAALAVPLWVDLACRVMSPLELRLSAHFVDDAADRLHGVAPIVVAITGSYGKTSTKGHIAALVGTTRTVVATPASFNNRAGLARAVNEHLADGTEVFVAEMGTYGPGEIADLCRWCPPDDRGDHRHRPGAPGAIRVRGPDRRGQVRDPRARPTVVVLQRRRPATGGAGRPGGGGGQAGGAVLGARPLGRRRAWCERRRLVLSAFVDGSPLAGDVEIPVGVQPDQCGLRHRRRPGARGRPRGRSPPRLPALPPVDHRLQVGRSRIGSDHPRRHLQLQSGGGVGGARPWPRRPGRPTRRARRTRRPVVPWWSPRAWWSSAPRQFDENRAFGAAVAAVATDLLIVGRTNQRALLAGVGSVGTARLVRATLVARTASEAVDWVRGASRPG